MSFLSNRRISFKLMVMAMLTFAGIVAVALVGLAALHANLLDDRKAKLRDAVHLAMQQMARDYREGLAAGLSQPDVTRRLRDTLRPLRYGHDDYFFAYDGRGVSLVLPDPASENQARWNLADSDGVYFVRDLIAAAGQGGGFVAYRFPRARGGAPEPKLAYAETFAPTGWMVGSGIYIDDVDTIFRAQLWRIGGFVGLTLGLIFGASILLGRSVARPIAGLSQVMHRLADGDLDVAVAWHDRHDEVGEMARALVVFKDSAGTLRRLDAERAATRQQAEASKRAALSDMATTIEAETGAALAQIHDQTASMTTTSDAMGASAARTGSAAANAEAAAAQALTNVQTVASAAEQLSASIHEIGVRIDQSNAIVGRAVTAGEEARATIETLDQEVASIGSVADMIREIAARTNLLALNATIEAARAGEAGKGFAVVAAEVKQLATQSAHSTDRIAQHLARVRDATGAAVSAVARIEQTVTEVHIVAGSIAAAVEQQGHATAEIARNASQTANAAHEMAVRTTEVSAEASHAGSHAALVRQNAAALNMAMGTLRHAVIHAVRTATPDVDRRGAVRYPVDRSGTITVGGRSQPVQVVDLSDGGAQLRAATAVPEQARGTLRVDGIEQPLPFAVRSAEGQSLHVAFALDAEAAARFRGAAERLAQRRAA